MPRLAYFLILSMTVHAALLAYPISFVRPSQVWFIPVTILTIEQGGTASNQNNGRQYSARVRSHSTFHRPTKIRPRHDQQPTEDKGLQVSTAGPAIEVSEAAPVSFSSATNGTGTTGAPAFDTISQRESDSGAGMGGNGVDSSDEGSGGGNGDRVASIKTTLIQARYRETPRPAYPESARRHGREGRVLLRVLVDEQGRAKQVEINDSSGSEALDRAAAEAIQRWRFYPARLADKPIETWLRVPIEFRLSETAIR
jgi:TonB family protein